MPLQQLLYQRIAILEDDKVSRERLSAFVRYNGGTPVPLNHAPNFENLYLYLDNEHISMLICDHRLYEHGNYANYNGAKAIAEGYKSGRGGVLVTSYSSSDAESSIREYRRWIPSLIHSTELKPDTLVAGLLAADREARQKISAKNRLPYRTLMTIDRVEEGGSDKIVKVVMSQWDINEVVGFPLNLVPKKMQSSIKPGNMLIAKVNIEANCAEELYFDEFELPDKDVLKKSESYFNHP